MEGTDIFISYTSRSWIEAQRSLYIAATSHSDCDENPCEVSGEYFVLDNLSFLVVRNSGF